MKFTIVMYFLALGLMPILTNCNGKNNKGEFKRDLPGDSTFSKELMQSIQEITDSLNLDNLNDGFNELQIRIWFRYRFTSTHQLVIIKKSNRSFEWTYGEFTPILDTNGMKVVKFERLFLEKTPGNNNVLLDSLISLDILTLPDWRKINGFPKSVHPNSVTFEISTRSTYRIYQYNGLSYTKDKFHEAKNVDSIIQILCRNLNIQLLAPI